MAPSLVQSKSGTISSGTSLTITLNSSTTAGNCLVVGVGAVQGSVNPTVSGITLGGSAGNFAQAAGQNTNADADAEVWIDPNCAGGQTSVVITFNSGLGAAQGNAAWVMEWSGVLTSSPTDKTNGATGSGTTWSSGSTGTLTQANEVAIGCFMSFSSTVTPPSSPWTELGTLTANGNRLTVGYQVVSATTALTYNGTATGSPVWATVIVTLKGLSSVTGTGSVGLGGLAFHGTGSIPAGRITLGGLALHGTAVQTFTGTGSLHLGGLAFAGSQTTVAPTIPTEPAGVIATSKDLNEWANASQFFMGSARGTRPIFYLMAATTQALTTSFTAVNYSNTAAVFKDNNASWASGNPSRYTVETPGFYSITYSVSAASGASRLQAYAQVTTTASNPFNPSTTVKFSSSSRTATTNVVVASGGGLVPIYLAIGDYLEVYALVGSAVNTSLTFPPQLTGEWVSA